MIGSIEEAAIDMHRRIDDLLELSRLGHATRSWAQVRTRDVVESALRTHEQSLPTPRYHISDPLPIVTGDVQSSSRAWTTSSPTPSSTGAAAAACILHVHPGPDSRHPQVRVADRGPGIEPRYSTSGIFGCSRELSDRTEGSGVGLALVRRVRRSMVAALG
jgi:signal transduction histidine kinase